jgi:hypothetical protein
MTLLTPSHPPSHPLFGHTPYTPRRRAKQARRFCGVWAGQPHDRAGRTPGNSKEETMTNTEFLTELHTQVLDCLRKCEDALDLLDGHDGRVPAKVRRALKELFAAAYDASHVVYYASEKKVQRSSATVHQLRPVP